MDNTKNKYRLTKEALKKEFNEERLKFLSKDKVINVVCAILALVAATLVFVYASRNGFI